MTHRHDVDVGPRSPARLVADVAQLIGLVGVSIPFGLHETETWNANAYEWTLAVVAAVAALGVLYDLARRQATPWPFALSAFVWAAHACYSAILPGAVIAARVAFVLIFAGYAFMAAGAWRISVHYAGREL